MTKIQTLCITVVALITVTSCVRKSTGADAATAADSLSRAELTEALADRDRLLDLVNEINSGMTQIKQLENILTVSNDLPGENTNQRQQIQEDIAAIQNALQQRRERLVELEKKLESSSTANVNLRKTIAGLRTTIDQQTAEIATLKDNLSQAQEHIGVLDATVDSLNIAVTTVTDERNAAQNESETLANELNTCYYAIGSKSELKNRNIIETGFLRKTKLLKGDFDQSFFTVADKRTLSRIALHSRKAEVLTNQPAGSYIIDDENGQKVLVITNSDAFWSMSNYLVVKID